LPADTLNWRGLPRILGQSRKFTEVNEGVLIRRAASERASLKIVGNIALRVPEPKEVVCIQGQAAEAVV
jgi:hypothetical protein